MGVNWIGCPVCTEVLYPGGCPVCGDTGYVGGPEEERCPEGHIPCEDCGGSTWSRVRGYWDLCEGDCLGTGWVRC